jgi:hypothetical protein
MGVHERPKAAIRLRIRYFPRKTAQNHAEEDDGDAPDVSLSRIVRLLAEDLRCQIRITADNASCRGEQFSRILEDGSCSEINQLDDVVVGHDAIIKFEIPMGQAKFVKVLYTIAYLTEDTVNFWSGHLPRHNDTKKVIWSIFHDLIGNG